jgi:proliferating cell nuclear antigen PCNA
MTVIFKVKTQEAYIIKILAELLANNIKTGCFEVDADGISLCMMDHHRKILIDLKLFANKLSTYKFNSKKMFLGINLNHFHKMLKSIKKKDSIELFIDDASPNDLGIRVIPKENTRVTTSFVTIQSIQNLDIAIPSGYGKPIIVSSTEYQKMVKDMANIGGNTMKVFSKGSYIEFSTNSGNILKRKVRFGEEDEDDEDDKKDEFCQDYVTEQLCRINKLSGLSTNIQIYTGKPLLFESNIGTIGKISIYIKSKEQIETESHTVDDSDYSSDE